MTSRTDRRQLEIVAFLEEENRVLREQLGGRGLRFTTPNAARRERGLVTAQRVAKLIAVVHTAMAAIGVFTGSMKRRPN